MLDNEKLKCPYFLRRTLVKQASSSNRYMWKLNGPPLLRRLLWVSETGFLFNGSSHWSNPFRPGLDSAESRILLRFKHFEWCSQIYLQLCLSVKLGPNLFSDLNFIQPCSMLMSGRLGWSASGALFDCAAEISNWNPRLRHHSMSGGHHVRGAGCENRG